MRVGRWFIFFSQICVGQYYGGVGALFLHNAFFKPSSYQRI